MNNPIGSSPCNHISIQNMGDETYHRWYEQFVFGTYSFLSIDSRSNKIYHVYHEFDGFMSKDMENDWIVSVTILLRYKRINLNKLE